MEAARSVSGADPAAPVHIQLLGGFAILVGDAPVALSADAQRLVAFLALERRRVLRAYAAGVLWGDGTQERAFGNLRSALWRVRRHADSVVEADAKSVALSSDTSVDVTHLVAQADCVHSRDCSVADIDPTKLSQSLLPGWYDEWVIVARERLRQVSLHALEALTDRLTTQGRHAAAVESALAAVGLDPLRESAHRRLICAHLDEGNRSEALRQFDSYQRLLRRELGLTPSLELTRLVGAERRLSTRRTAVIRNG